MAMNQQYARELKQETSYLATWLPNVRVAPGHVGRITNFQFTPLGELRGFGIDFATEGGDSPADFEYYSTGAVSMSLKLAGAAPPLGSVLASADAGINLAFARESAVAFRAADCTSARISDQLKLEHQVLQLHENREWPDDLVVVVEVVSAGATTILIASEAGASMDLRARGTVDVASIHLADVHAGLEIAGSRKMGIQIVAAAGLTPLIRTAGIKKKLFGSRTFRADARQATPGEVMFGAVDYDDFA